MGAFIRPKLMTGAPGNWSNFKNPQVDRMLEEHLQTLERTKQHELLKDILKIVYETAELTSAFAVTQAVEPIKGEGNSTYWRHIAAGKCGWTRKENFGFRIADWKRKCRFGIADQKNRIGQEEKPEISTSGARI